MKKDMFLEKFYMPETIWICTASRVSKGVYLTAWINLSDMLIRHSINGVESDITFTTMDSFASYIEGLTEPKNKKQ